jgi:hypothetical protein
MVRIILLLILLIVAVVQAYAAPIHRSAAVKAEFQRLHPCPANGLKHGPCPGWIKDHIKPLCAGGPDAVGNMQWQTLAASRLKDAKERAECAQLRRHPHV